jgi:N-acetylmuramoyl-L-alanine amidase
MDGIDATGPEPGAHSATGGSMAPGRSTVLLGLCATALLCATSSLAASRVTASELVVVVQPGDTLVGLAARYGTSVAVIATLNGIANPDLIRAGQRVRVTVGRSVNARDKGDQHHVVRPGETLTSIAADFGTTIEAIAAANRLTDPSYVWAGRRLVIPSAIRSKTHSGRHGSQPPTVRRLVAPGETLTAIAQRYGTTVAAIASLNNLADPSYIQAGQILRIPSAEEGTTAATLPSSVAAGMAGRDRVRRIVVTEARRAGVPPALALSVAWQESGWRQKVVSSAGARGVMQLMPTTAVWIGDTMLGHRVDLRNTRGNVRAGLVLLRHYLDRYHGNVGRALAAYYQGQRSADIYGVLPVSRPYIASILTLQRMLH